MRPRARRCALGRRNRRARSRPNRRCPPHPRRAGPARTSRWSPQRARGRVPDPRHDDGLSPRPLVYDLAVSAEDDVPSAPLAADIQHVGGRIFERIRRETVRSRRCAPCDNSWVAVDRIVHDGRVGLLFHRNHDCTGNAALRRDLVERDLSALGFEARRELPDGSGQIDVITGDCPGVRLRALVEVLKASGSSLPRDVAWHIVSRTAELRAVWNALDVEPGDTIVGFDGSLHPARGIVAWLVPPPRPAPPTRRGPARRLLPPSVDRG